MGTFSGLLSYTGLVRTHTERHGQQADTAMPMMMTSARIRLVPLATVRSSSEDSRQPYIYTTLFMNPTAPSPSFNPAGYRSGTCGCLYRAEMASMYPRGSDHLYVYTKLRLSGTGQSRIGNYAKHF